MGKKKNVIKRNSGFIAGCVLAAGASFFAADFAMTNGLPTLAPEPSDETQEATVAGLEPEETEKKVYETDPFTVTSSGNIIKGVETEKQTQESGEPQTDEQGNVIGYTDADAGSDEGSDTDDGSQTAGTSDGSGSTPDEGSGSGDGSTDGSANGGSDGSWSGGTDDSWDESWDGSGQSIEIYDPGNGDYSYNDGGNTGNTGGNSDSGSWDDSGSGSGDGSGAGDGGSPDGNDAVTPSDVIIWDISSRYIDESELYNYDAGQLRLIRNEIFALNGRIFQSQDLRDYFSQKSWYVPTYSPEEFDANMFYYLNDYEEANLEVILNYEAALAGN